MNCKANSSGVNSCTHAQDVGVRCPPGIYLVMYVHLYNNIILETGFHAFMHNNLMHFIGCTEGDIRLVQGNTPREGRVEICNMNAWGTVCDNGWDSFDARVVCRQLGLSTAGITSKHNFFSKCAIL